MVWQLQWNRRRGRFGLCFGFPQRAEDYRHFQPAAPMEIGICSAPGAEELVVSGGYAYLAAGMSGLRIIDVSNPTSPAEVGIYDTPGNASDIAINGIHAFVADYSTGILVINVANPSAPYEVGIIRCPAGPTESQPVAITPL